LHVETRAEAPGGQYQFRSLSFQHFEPAIATPAPTRFFVTGERIDGVHRVAADASRGGLATGARPDRGATLGGAAGSDEIGHRRLGLEDEQHVTLGRTAVPPARAWRHRTRVGRNTEPESCGG
jgi:hypothetical protein